VLPTFVIGLREGLEAALIVSIIATFLRRNGAGLRGMWLGVALGIAISIAVGVVLRVVEQNLPQAKQEGMETVIGLVAVFFVTGMIFWMRTHARFMKRDLELHASEALSNGTTTALVVMAFLAVLREGFETSVFLLATFQSATSAPSAIIGAVLGIVVAVGLGWGIYRGGVRLNLQRFFTVTGLFLVLVAAGLVLNALRTAHEAGWVTIGQGTTVDLSWLAPAGSIQSALISGVLGIPRDPRMVEVLAWAIYLVPMLVLALWPARHRPGRALARRISLGGAVAALVAAVLLAVLVPLPTASVASSAPVAGGGTARVTWDSGRPTVTRAGHTYADLRQTSPGHWSQRHVAGDLPASVDATTLLGYNGGRSPVGLDVSAAPGPYRASWTDGSTLKLTTHGTGLVDAAVTGTVLLRLSGGGLTSTRVLSIDRGRWSLTPAYVAHTAAALTQATLDRRERALWKTWFPVFLVVVAAGLLWRVRRLRPTPQTPTGTGATGDRDLTTPASQRTLEGTTHHARSSA
jgi:high-affinity iron transporter